MLWNENTKPNEPSKSLGYEFIVDCGMDLKITNREAWPHHRKSATMATWSYLATSRLSHLLFAIQKVIDHIPKLYLPLRIIWAARLFPIYLIILLKSELALQWSITNIRWSFGKMFKKENCIGQRCTFLFFIYYHYTHKVWWVYWLLATNSIEHSNSYRLQVPKCS